MSGPDTPGPPAHFETQPQQDCVVVVATGEIDYQIAARLAATIYSAAASCPRVIVDLSAVAFIDSTGLGALMGARFEAEAEGGCIELVHPPRLVRRLLASTGLQRAFRVYETIDEALSSARSNRVEGS